MFDIWAVSSFENLYVAVRKFRQNGFFWFDGCLFYDFNAFFEAYAYRVGASRKRNVAVAVFQVWSELTFGTNDVNAVV